MAERAAVASSSANPQRKRPGRRRDPSRDGEILAVVIDILADVGYEGTTMELVALRARAGKGTVYRRWSSKAAMVVDAITWMKATHVDLAALPDTGTLRGDLLGLYRLDSATDRARKLRAMAALASVLSQHPELAAAGNSALMDPWIAAQRLLMERAAARGELPPGFDIAIASHVIPSIASYRSLILREPFTRELLVALIDGVLLPRPRSRRPKR